MGQTLAIFHTSERNVAVLNAKPKKIERGLAKTYAPSLTRKDGIIHLVQK